MSLAQKIVTATLSLGIALGGGCAITPVYTSSPHSCHYQRDRISLDSLAVVIIDMQNYFLDQLSLDDREDLVEQQKSLLKYCQREGIKVFVLEYQGLGETTEELKTELANLSEIEYIQKPHDGAFEETHLDQRLKAEGLTHLLLSGVTAGACVKQTFIQGRERGYQVITTRNLIADKPVYKGTMVDEMQHWYPAVVDGFERTTKSVLEDFCK